MVEIWNLTAHLHCLLLINFFRSQALPLWNYIQTPLRESEHPRIAAANTEIPKEACTTRPGDASKKMHAQNATEEAGNT